MSSLLPRSENDRLFYRRPRPATCCDGALFFICCCFCLSLSHQSMISSSPRGRADLNAASNLTPCRRRSRILRLYSRYGTYLSSQSSGSASASPDRPSPRPPTLSLHRDMSLAEASHPVTVPKRVRATVFRAAEGPRAVLCPIRGYSLYSDRRARGSLRVG